MMSMFEKSPVFKLSVAMPPLGIAEAIHLFIIAKSSNKENIHEKLFLDNRIDLLIGLTIKSIYSY